MGSEWPKMPENGSQSPKRPTSTVWLYSVPMYKIWGHSGPFDYQNRWEMGSKLAIVSCDKSDMTLQERLWLNSFIGSNSWYKVDIECRWGMAWKLLCVASLRLSSKLKILHKNESHKILAIIFLLSCLIAWAEGTLTPWSTNHEAWRQIPLWMEAAVVGDGACVSSALEHFSRPWPDL